MPITTSQSSGNRYVTIDLAAPGTSEPWQFQENQLSYVSVGVYPATAATGRIEFTISSPEKIAADTAVWLPWGKGDVTVNSMDVIPAKVSAIRLVSTAGAVDAELLY